MTPHSQHLSSNAVITTGEGLIKRIRTLTLSEQDSKIFARICAESQNKNSIPFDVNAATEQAKSVLWSFMHQANNSEKMVKARFEIADARIGCTVFKKGARAGQTGLLLKGQLLCLSHVWIKRKDAPDDAWQLGYEWHPSNDVHDLACTQQH